MEFFGGMIGLTIAWWTVAITVASLLFPVFWIWMLVDSIMRNDNEYPSGGPNEKIVWVVLLALVQIVAVFYYFMVYRVARRGTAAVPAAPQTFAQQTPPAASAC